VAAYMALSRRQGQVGMNGRLPLLRVISWVGGMIPPLLLSVSPDYDISGLLMPRGRSSIRVPYHQKHVKSQAAILGVCNGRCSGHFAQAFSSLRKSHRMARLRALEKPIIGSLAIGRVQMET
jgi:hypothetical protein